MLTNKERKILGQSTTKDRNFREICNSLFKQVLVIWVHKNNQKYYGIPFKLFHDEEMSLPEYSYVNSF